MSNVSLIDGHIDEMIDTEIIKALECCLDNSPLTCKDCPMFNVTNSTMVCSKIVTKFALDLINRQQAEIERLNNNLSAMVVTMRNSAKATRNEAIKEFAERLKEKKQEVFTAVNDSSYAVTVYKIDNLVKEMVGEEK